MKNKWSYMITVLLLLIAQAAVDNFINLSIYTDLALFLFIILMLPYRISTITAMIISFCLGLCVDFLGNIIIGMTSAALVVTALLRRSVISLSINQDILEKNSSPSLESLGIRRFISYSLPLILVYDLSFILVDCSGFAPFWHNMLRLCISVAVNTLVAVFLFIVCSDRKR